MDGDATTTQRRPLVVGIGGTIRSGSTSEAALQYALAAAAAAGGDTRLLGGEFLSRLPVYDPRPGEMTDAQAELVTTVRAADAIIIASPGYHGSISGVMKNALDTLELTANDAAPYFEGRPVGTIVTSYGWQAAGSALMALRMIVHAMRGWPTPFGATLNSTCSLFDASGACTDSKDAWALTTVAHQVMDFAGMRARFPQHERMTRERTHGQTP